MSRTPAEIARIDQHKAAVRDRLDRLVEHAREHIAGGCKVQGCPGLDVVADVRDACPTHNDLLVALAVWRLASTEGGSS